MNKIMKNEKIRAIIFDMGGVIILTCDDSPRIALARQLGVSIEELSKVVFTSKSAIRSEGGEINKNDHWKNVLRSLSKDPGKNMTPYDEAFWAGDCIDNELMQFIYLLKKKYKIGFLSNAFLGAREFVEGHFHFLDAFDLTIFSYEVKLRKPDPKIYQLVCDRLAVHPEEAIFIDDMSVNVEGARLAGLHAIQYKNKKQLKTQLANILGPDFIN
jgi:epoxide hydrolase-like predicted phosphatase